jgi:hypothetical protein
MPPSNDPPPSGGLTPKIAIKGFSLSSKNGAAKSTSKPQLSSTLGKRPRSTFAHGDDSDGDDRRPKAEVVTGFGEEGAIRHVEKKREGPLVIDRLENTSGLGMKRGAGMKNLLPPELLAARERARIERENGGAVGTTGGIVAVKKEGGVEVLNGGEEKVQWGLTVRKRVKIEDEDLQSKMDESANGHADSNHESTTEKPKEEEKPKTADEEALAALLGQETKKKGPDLVIASTLTDKNARPHPLSEEDAYHRAIASAPEVSTLEDYERIPVEEFGAALLRGMGWKGEKTGTVKEVKRRQNLLGLGAKELDGAEELGAWVQKSDVKRLKPAASGGGDRKPKVNEYKREEERRKERREERGGGSYRREREREREYERDERRDRDREYERRDRRR